MSSLITAELVSLDADLGTQASDVIARLAATVAAAGRATEAEGLTADALAREAQSATGLPGGIAIPHCRSTSVTEPTLAFARLAPKADFGAPDGPADLVFMIAAPDGAGTEHLKLLSSLARALVKPAFTDALRAATTADEVVALVDGVVAPAEGAGASTPSAAPVATEPKHAATPNDAFKVVAVTACPTGIAHTYMAADSLTQAAADEGIDLQVETQGSSGSTPLSAATIAAADAVIFATDVGVKNEARFAGKPVVVSGVKRAINEPSVMLAEARRAATDPKARRVGGTVDTSVDETEGAGIGLKLRQWLLTGVSYMIPFVAAGGLLIALGFLLGGYDIALNNGDGVQRAQAVFDGNTLFDLPSAGQYALFDSGLMTYLGSIIFLLGAWAFSFLVPALAGYIAYAMADRPGIAPGFVMGYVANQIGGGFIGGIVGGLLAGLFASWFTRRTYPRWLQGLMPVVVIPLAATLVVGLVMILALDYPLSWINESLSDGLNSMSGTSAVVLGAVLGLMMCFDLGGPVNKAAYVFAVTGLSTAGALEPGSSQTKIMAAVMISGMVPPLAMALSTALRPRLYSTEERENGKSAWLLGASFISEGAIPFAAADPLRVIPSMMLGGAVSGAISMAAGVTLKAPHGGVFVFFAVDQVIWFFVAIVVGTLVSALAVTALKQIGRDRTDAAFAYEHETVPANA